MRQVFLFTSLLSFQRTELKKAVQTELQLPLKKWLQAVPKEWKAKEICRHRHQNFADKNETIISVRDNGDEFDPLNDDKEFEMSPHGCEGDFG